jgi:hypothetical protein
MASRKSRNSSALEEPLYVKKAKRGSVKANQVVESNEERNFEDIIVDAIDEDNAEADTGVGLVRGI